MGPFALFASECGMPPIPDTGWRPPEDFPNLAAAEALSIDVETCDPGLTTRGPGWATGDGHIVGLAVGTQDGGRWYFPMRHSVGGGNMDPEAVLRWARDELSRAAQPKVGANIGYDVGWLAAEGVEVKGQLHDVQYAEPLLDEHAGSYSLEALGRKYLSLGKTSEALYEWCARAYGGAADGKQRKNIHRAPAALVGLYAEGDVDLPFRVLEKQRSLLAAEGLTELYELECRLIPMLVAMCRRGVRVDVARARSVGEELAARVKELAQGADIWAAESLSRLCVKDGVVFPRTAAGAPSFTKGWLEHHTHPLMQAVARARKLDKARGTFVDGHVLGHAGADGRVHIVFNPLRNDDGGTVSGRFSSTHHNLPKRDDELGPLVRGLFLPEDGEDWWSFDYSQIEPRLQFHYASGPLAEAMRERLRADPSLSCYHLMMDDMRGLDVDRESFYSTFKGIWLGISYGMGVPKTAASLGVSHEQARAWREAFPPYILQLFDRAAERAASQGVITTLLGRRARFPLWESRDWDTAQRDGALPEAAARERYGKAVRRAWTHKALNRLAQGSAADVMKKAMVDIWESGVCAVLGAPLLTIHDQLDFSASRTPEALEALREVKRIMENCVTLRVPLRVDVERGLNWGALEEVEL